MMPRTRVALAALLAVAVVAGTASAGDLTSSLKKGTPELKSVGPIAFGPEGILFVADPQAAAILAVDTGDKTGGTGSGPIRVEAIDGKVASLLGTTDKQLLFNHLAVNPASGKAYLSVSRGRGPDAMPVIVRINREGQVEEFPLKEVNFSKAELPNPPEGGQRQESITKLAYVDGRVLVAGLSNEEFSSELRAIPFPFVETGKGTSIEIYHGAHGRLETKSPIRTFVPYQIKGEAHILAAYQCTPLVKIPVAELKTGAHVKGTTIAELGNMNRPLDMIVYEKDGKEYILIANNRRGVMKVSTENIDQIAGITQPIRGGKTAGLPYETIASLKGVLHMDRLDREHALVLLQGSNGALNLDTLALP
jgi:hypothetical protein